MNQIEAQKELQILKIQVEKLEAIINKPKDIFDIKTYSDVCKELNEKELTLEDFEIFEGYSEKLLAFAKIKQLEKYFNQGWTPNWQNKDEYKWYPYFEFTVSGGFGLSVVIFLFWCSYAVVGFYRTKKIANHIGINFSNIYKELH